MRRVATILSVLMAVVVLGCLEDDDAPVQDVVLGEETSYYAGLVKITERQVRINSMQGTTLTVQGTVTNFGADLTAARYDLVAENVVVELDGTTVYANPRVVASQSFGDLKRNQSLPLNVSWSYEHMTPLRFRGEFHTN